MRLVLLALIVTAACAPPSGLVVETFLSGTPRTLVAVLHGDSPEEPPSYQYEVARRTAERNKNVVAAGILRPGYSDARGRHSAGTRGTMTGDNYTVNAVDAVLEAIRRHQRFHKTERTVVVGHSGGASIAALLASRHHGVVDAVVLVACPCDLDTWREQMGWTDPVESLSPLDRASSFDPDTSVVMIVGNEDDITPFELSRTYAKALQSNGTLVELTVLPGKGHDVMFESSVERIIDRAVRGESR